MYFAQEKNTLKIFNRKKAIAATICDANKHEVLGKYTMKKQRQDNTLKET